MTAFARLGSSDVIEARVLMPRLGAWTADVRLDTSSSPSGRQRLTLGNLSIVGTVRAATLYRGSVQARIVGGADGLARPVKAKGYVSSPLKVPLLDLLTEVGETLSPHADSNLTGYQLRHWMRLSGTAGHALSTLVHDAGGAWRFLPDGTLWVGHETWPSSRASVEPVAFNPLADKLTFFSKTPGVLPGETFSGRRVSYVEHFIGPERIESHVWFEGQS